MIQKKTILKEKSTIAVILTYKNYFNASIKIVYSEKSDLCIAYGLPFSSCGSNKNSKNKALAGLIIWQKAG